MSNGRDESTSAVSGADREPTAVQKMPPIPVLLRALASYLEVTGESEKFTRHLIAVMEESGQELEVADVAGDLDSGGRPIQI